MNILSWGIKMGFLKYWWRRFITLFENLFKKTQKEQDLDAPAPLKEDLDAPVPANKQKKGNPLFQRDGVLNPFLGANAPLSQGRVAKERNSVSVAMANGCVANERHYVSNNIKNIGGNNMGLFQSKPKQPKTKEDFDHAIQKKKDAIQKEKDELRDLEKGRDEFIEKNGIKPIQGEKIFNTSISSIKSMNEDNNLDSNEYKPFLGTPANSNNAKFNEIDKQFQQMENKLAESTNGMNKLKEQVNNHEEKINKNTEDIKKNTEDIKKTQEEQIDIKKLLAKHDEMIAEMKEENKDSKRRLDKAEKMLEDMKEERKDTKRMLEKMDEDKKAHDELMAALWNKLDEWNGIKESTREGNDNRESTNTSFSSFKYKNPFRNNTRQPKMERPDMAHSHDEN